MRDRLSDVTIIFGVACLIVGAALTSIALGWTVAGVSIIGYGLHFGLATSKKKGN